MATKKKWFNIVSPKMFGEKPIGETMALEGPQLINRKIEVNMMNLSKNYSRFYVKLIFQIKRVEGETAYTEFIGHDIMRERIYRMVQRRVRRVDCVQDVKTKDGRKVRVKTVFVLNRRVNTSIKNDTRKFTKELIDKIGSKMDFENFIKIIIEGNLQKQIKIDCSRIYPVGQVEIRKTEVVQTVEKPKVKVQT